MKTTLAAQIALLLTALSLPSACSSGSEPAGAGSPGAQATTTTVETTAVSTAAADKRKPRGRPLPAFQGLTLDGRQLAISSLLGKRIVLFFFNPEMPEAASSARAVTEIAAQQASHNFQVVGVGIGSNRDRVRGLAEAQGFEFPVIDDSSGTITRTLGLRDPVMIVGVDAEGHMDFVVPPAASDDRVAALTEQLRSELRLPVPDAATGALVQRVSAPDFEAERLQGGRFSFSELTGRPVVLIFFLHTCPHCHHALEALRDQLARMPEDKRPALKGVSVSGAPGAVRRSLREEKLDFFDVLLDQDDAIKAKYNIFGGVPVVLLIGADGKIRHRVQGWNDRDAAMVRMWLAKIAGVSVPMLLNPNGYTGSDACGVCHEVEYETWQLTQHASAYDTLVTHGDHNDGECVSCHVVGFGKPGGYSFDASPAHLENVGCESCHGRGGPHLSPAAPSDANGGYEATCKGCHNPTHSLGFEYTSFVPKVSHAAIAALSPAERAALVAARGEVRDVLPKGADYMGSASCQGCHASEYATWAGGEHARATATLEARAEAANADCLKCHTTGFGRPGGFPRDGLPADHAALTNVGCESCHGPGGDHVADGARRIGTIVSLGDKCDSCVILQICGSCHDQANDPGFEFSVQEHIDRQRHGTIEAGTGKPKDRQAFIDAHMRRELGDHLRRAGAS